MLGAGLIEQELRLQQYVAQLSGCGVRPSTIRMIVGSKISRNEIERIFKLTTKRGATERGGRVISVSQLRRMDLERRGIYSRLIHDVVALVSQSADLADALVAVWRVETGRMGVPEHCVVHGDVSLENLAILYMNFKSGELSFDPCHRCGHAFLAEDLRTAQCPFCEPQHARRRRVANYC